ncbi:MAG: DMT family transporter [Motiliproteus sp.]|nr:DMT family transporter [Motiliproteus sp.]MCW9051671.1 DMT family transporter [Motiliproteus sp.]
MTDTIQEPMRCRSDARSITLALIAVSAFALTLPATRIALEGLSPWFVGFSRSAIAGVVAALLLKRFNSPLPKPRQVAQLLMIAIGIVFGFPLCTALGMQTAPAAHGGILLGILPLLTAVFGSYLTRENSSLIFWLCSLVASCVVIIYASSGESNHWQAGDLWLTAAVILAAWGYAFSGRLSVELGGWQVICWALVFSLPISLPVSIYLIPTNTVTFSSWSALLYLALISQLFAFFCLESGACRRRNRPYQSNPTASAFYNPAGFSNLFR